MNRKFKRTAFKIEFFSKKVKVFNVTFDQFNASVVSKSSPLKKGEKKGQKTFVQKLYVWFYTA